MVQNIFRFEGGREPDPDEIAAFDAVVAQLPHGNSVPLNFMVDLTAVSRKLPFPYVATRVSDILSVTKGLKVPLFEMMFAIGSSKGMSASDQILNELLLRNLKDKFWAKDALVSRRMAVVFDAIAGHSPLQGLSAMGSTSSIRVFGDISKFSDQFTSDQILTLAVEAAKLAEHTVARHNFNPTVIENIRRAIDYYGHMAMERFPEPKTGALTPLFQAVSTVWTRVLETDARFDDFAPSLAGTLTAAEQKKQLSRILNPYFAASNGSAVPQQPLDRLDVAILKCAGFSGSLDQDSLKDFATTHFASQNVHAFPPRRPK